MDCSLGMQTSAVVTMSSSVCASFLSVHPNRVARWNAVAVHPEADEGPKSSSQMPSCPFHGYASFKHSTSKLSALLPSRACAMFSCTCSWDTSHLDGSPESGWTDIIGESKPRTGCFERGCMRAAGHVNTAPSGQSSCWPLRLNPEFASYPGQCSLW